MAAVEIRRVPGYEDAAAMDEAVEAIFAALPAAGRIGPGMRVLLKPNLLARHAPEKAVTTHPAVVRAVIHAVRRRGAQQIVLADSAGGPYAPAMMKGIYKASGLWQVCEEEGVEAYTGCRSRAVPAQGVVAKRFELLEPVLDADFIINLPKLKTHVMTGASLSIKNLFGCVPGLQKAEWHMRQPEKERFGDMLVDLWQTVCPDLAIMDGVFAMEGDGPSGGRPYPAGLLLGGQDMAQLDLACCALLGLEPMRVPYLEAACRRGLCARAFEWDEEGGRQALEPLPGFALPESYQVGEVDFAKHAPRALRWATPAVERWLAPRPVVVRSKCIGCGKCAEICPQDTILLKGKARIQSARCIRCFCCHEMCPVQAIRVRRSALLRNL